MRDCIIVSGLRDLEVIQKRLDVGNELTLDTTIVTCEIYGI